MNLFELIDDRIVSLEAGAGTLEDVLQSLALAMPPADPLARLVAAAGRGTQSFRVLHPGPGVAVVDMGPDSPRPVAAMACVPAGFGPDGDRRSVAWIIAGLERPVVNLQVTPGIRRFHEELDPFHLCAGEVGSSAVPKLLSGIAVERALRVKHALTPLSYRIYPDTPLPEVMDLMVRRQVAAVPVVGEGLEVLGVITAGDILPHVLPASEGKGEAPEGMTPTARDVMTRTVLCVSEEEGLIEATRKMISRGVSQLPVVREGELIGFLERKTVMRALAPSGGSRA